MPRRPSSGVVGSTSVITAASSTTAAASTGECILLLPIHTTVAVTATSLVNFMFMYFGWLYVLL